MLNFQPGLLGETVKGHDRSDPTSTLTVYQVYAGRSDARHDWATSWLISPCGLQRLLWTCRDPLFCLSNQRTWVRWQPGADRPPCGSDPCSATSWTTPMLSMWSFIRLTLALRTRSQLVFCCGPNKLCQLECAGDFRPSTPRASTLGRCIVIPRRGQCRPLGRPPSARRARNSGLRLSARGWHDASAPTSAPRLALGIGMRRLCRRRRRRTKRGKERYFASNL